MGTETIRKFQKELNSGAISLVVLALIGDRQQSLYGYEISKALASQSNGSLPMNEAAIYPVLRSLERQGLLSSFMQRSESGPPRKYYQLTAEGHGALVEWRDAWNNTKTFVDQVLAGSQVLENCHDRSVANARSKIPRTV